MPVGQFGITKISQTPFYHKFGRFATLAALTMPYIAFYAWFRISTFCMRRLWNNIVLQEREWYFEVDRNNYYGNYYFLDTPLASEDSIAYFGLSEIGSKNAKKMPKPEWATD